MFDRWIEDELLETVRNTGIGCICFSPLDQGILTDKYLEDIPGESRAGKLNNKLAWGDEVTQERIDQVVKLNKIAERRKQTLAQMAISWVLRHPQMSSALVGASRVSQVDDCVGALTNLSFSGEELSAIDSILA